MKSCFPDEIVLRDAGMYHGSRIFRLEHYFRYISSLGVITIPTGFLTDGASVPRVFWPIFDPFGPYFPSALVHDFLYSKDSDRHFNCNRYTSDRLFKEAMYNAGIGWPTRETIYYAVRLGGGRSFKQTRPFS